MHKSEIAMRKRYLFVLFFVLFVVCCFAQPVTITPSSATIQPGESVTLTASGAMYYQWSPATGLSTTEGPVTVASPMVTTTYTCSGYAPGDESVVNGDFNQGNVGFTSSYQYNTNLWNEGTFYVDYDVSPHHANFHGVGHGDSGNFMIVNGSTMPHTNVWTEEITVNPNTNYAFSTWVCTLAGQANEVAQLQFSINGVQLGNIFSAPPSINEWLQFYVLWNSGNATSATITILNQNTGGSGNDFGLDDISFRELVLVGAPQCTVNVGNMSASAFADQPDLCQGSSTTLHALPTGGSGHYTYSWSPNNTLDNPTAQHPVATPNVGTTTYYCHIVDVDWSSSQDVSVAITVHPTYDETTIDTAICYGESYNFYGTTFDHSVTNIPHTLYTGQGCDSIVRLNLTVWDENPILPDQRDLCTGDTLVWFDGNKYYHDGDVAYYDSVDIHGCLQVYKLELIVGEYQTPQGYIPDKYVCVPHDEDPYYYWDIAHREYHDNAFDSVIIADPNGGCDFKYRLNLKFRREFYQKDSVVECGKYYWPITGETYYETHVGSDTITKTFFVPFGNEICDSTYVLKLIINEEIIDPAPITIPGDCDSTMVIPWIGHDTVYFHEDTPVEGFTFIGETDESCHREQTVYVENMKYTPKPSKVKAVDPATVVYGWAGAEADTAAVVTNTEFFSFQYTFYVEESNSKCIWDSCVWSISKPSWDIEFNPEPTLRDGKYYSECKVFVADEDDDFVVLAAIVDNGCGTDTCKIYLKSSFLDVEENVHAAVGVDIIPNPNKGQMTLVFNGFEGKSSVKVFDVTGNLVDSFETYNDSECKVLEYNLSGRKGMYFFVVNGKEGILAKKVLIE